MNANQGLTPTRVPYADMRPVLYLNPHVPDDCGTSFYRQRLAQGQRGGNMVMPPKQLG
jgi:hypothetical protein